LANARRNAKNVIRKQAFPTERQEHVQIRSFFDVDLSNKCNTINLPSLLPLLVIGRRVNGLDPCQRAGPVPVDDARLSIATVIVLDVQVCAPRD
jgi:hypothetical protein